MNDLEMWRERCILAPKLADMNCIGIFFHKSWNKMMKGIKPRNLIKNEN